MVRSSDIRTRDFLFRCYDFTFFKVNDVKKGNRSDAKQIFQLLRFELIRDQVSHFSKFLPNFTSWTVQRNLQFTSQVFFRVIRFGNWKRKASCSAYGMPIRLRSFFFLQNIQTVRKQIKEILHEMWGRSWASTTSIGTEIYSAMCFANVPSVNCKVQIFLLLTLHYTPSSVNCLKLLLT